MMPLSKFKQYEERIAAVLSRTSVFDLREMAPAEILVASKKMSGLELDSKKLLDNWCYAVKVKSGANIYELRIFENWAFCSCPATTCCKHIPFAMRTVDQKSFHRIIEREKWDQGKAKITNALLTSKRPKTQKIDGIPI